MNDAFSWPEYLPAFRMAAQQAGFMETILTETPEGPLSAWTRKGTGEKNVYLSAGIHGDEPAGPQALLQLMRDAFFSHDIHWAICPALNPSGLATGTRETTDGADINRDYLKRSTPEAKAHAAWLERQATPDLFLSLHEDWETAGFYLYEINQGDDQPERTKSILGTVQPWFHSEPGVIDGHHTREPGWIYHEAEPDIPEGWPEAIFIAKQNCRLSFTFETPSQAKLTDRTAAHCAAVRAALAW